MDLDTENKIAAILLREAAEMRQEAAKEGVLAYLRQPNVRAKPNSRFLTATVLGVQQANRAVEMNEMWHTRHKERELNDKLKGKPRNESRSDRKERDISNYPRSDSKRRAIDDDNASASCSSGHDVVEFCHLREDDGLRDKEIEEFLHSRVKCGRGAVGSRMDETGPYLPPCSDSNNNLSTSPCRRRVIYGPDKPSSLKSYDSSDNELEKKRKAAKMDLSNTSNEKHRLRHESIRKSREKRKRRNKQKLRE